MIAFQVKTHGLETLENARFASNKVAVDVVRSRCTMHGRVHSGVCTTEYIRAYARPSARVGHMHGPAVRDARLGWAHGAVVCEARLGGSCGSDIRFARLGWACGSVGRGARLGRDASTVRSRRTDWLHTG